MPMTTTQPHTEEKREKSIPPDYPIFKNEVHRKENDIPLDYQVAETDETQLEEPKLKERKKLYSQAFRLNGEVDEVRNCVRGIEGIVSIKSNAPDSDEELYQIGPGYIGLHPSSGYVGVNGVEIDVMDKFVNIFYGVKD